MRIAYVTTYDVFDSSQWNQEHTGLFTAGRYLAKSLESASLSLDYIGPLQKKRSPITRAKWLYYRNLYHQDYYSWTEPFILKHYARQIEKKLSTLNVDIIVTPENVLPIAYLKAKQSIVLYTDAAIGNLVDFYPYLSNLCQETLDKLYDLEKRAIDNCELAIYTSDWAAQQAIKLYNINPAKVKVVPWGATIECDRTKNDIQKIIESRPPSPCKLLFLGFDWHRKGGDIALEVTKQLNKNGFKTELIVVGAKPPHQEQLPDFVKIIGKIDKSHPEGKHKLDQILANSHFLILPTKAETYGLVFCEANSFGVPCIASDIGGIPTIIQDDLNGKTFSLTAKISEYCEYVSGLISDYDKYQQIAYSSFLEYENRLNWTINAENLKATLQSIL
ncbi:glycosyltransferase family 4 protein [Roseofilum reptotaenium CS-1145]|uniref:Group 1 glycosyl transferase n=1 Tax=Roseofilum reptotaenium AO1-A TaxID=1925591 RepID=A0A1L9QPR9_9CYAN|nr:glycosyltransferase family 4 protein [Roseofilum reptotaenium]MDB9516632.1 glycosyltransferase family 4 protein [Roseofilum reptotaenium CS-1145]OJJ24675.1 group 1 glycosyl transferase [Roseofilum reptotaenium AO1-A]